MNTCTQEIRGTMSKTRIRALLVEDSRIVARFLAEVLDLEEADGIEIVHSEDLAGAADVLRRQQFDVLLLDLSLPDSTGIDTIVRARALSAGTPIVVLSSADDEEIRTEAIRQGAHDYLVKGEANGETIMQAIREAIKCRRCRKEGSEPAGNPLCP
jgi:DNA-binding NarL/FixJ family response regulator